MYLPCKVSTVHVNAALLPCTSISVLCCFVILLYIHSIVWIINAYLLISTIKELEFSVVTLTDDGTPREVAIKSLNHHACSADKMKFLQEVAIMTQFFHDDIIKLYEIISKGPLMIILEYANKGDLRNYLIELQPDNIIHIEVHPC